MIMLMPRRYIVANVNSVQNNYNLFAAAGSPNNAVTVLNFINANCNSNNTSTPAYDTGTGWYAGSYLYIQNSAKINGLTGTTGANGAGGSGGIGGT
jgi:hypothetical protein